jgi:hypothetical protein
MKTRSSRQRIVAVAWVVWVLLLAIVAWTVLVVISACSWFDPTNPAANYEPMIFDGLLTVVTFIALVVCTCVLVANRKKPRITVSL